MNICLMLYTENRRTRLGTTYLFVNSVFKSKSFCIFTLKIFKFRPDKRSEFYFSYRLLHTSTVCKYCLNVEAISLRFIQASRHLREYEGGIGEREYITMMYVVHPSRLQQKKIVIKCHNIKWIDKCSQCLFYDYYGILKWCALHHNPRTKSAQSPTCMQYLFMAILVKCGFTFYNRVYIQNIIFLQKYIQSYTCLGPKGSSKAIVCRCMFYHWLMHIHAMNEDTKSIIIASLLQQTTTISGRIKLQFCFMPTVQFQWWQCG